jgi:serine/threonine protein kinase
VKPDHVILAEDGRVVLIDLDGSMEIQPEKSEDTRLLGTALYAAPEQFGLARSDQRTDVYAVGILLNEMLTGAHPAVKQYLDMRNDWKSDIGHPWEMIEFYRGMLTDDLNVKLRHLNKAAEIAVAGGPTLHIIASVILGSLFFYDRRVGDKLRQLAEITISEIPDMGSARAAALRSQLVTPLQPIEFAKAVLPFNFR